MWGKTAPEEVFSSYKQIQEWGSAAPAASVLEFFSSVVNQGRTRPVIARIFEYADLLCSFNQQSFVEVHLSNKQEVLAVERLNSVCRSECELCPPMHKYLFVCLFWLPLCFCLYLVQCISKAALALLTIYVHR